MILSNPILFVAVMSFLVPIGACVLIGLAVFIGYKIFKTKKRNTERSRE